MDSINTSSYEKQENIIIKKLLLYFTLQTIAISFLHLYIPGILVDLVQISLFAGFCWNLIKLAGLQNISSKYLRFIFIVFSAWVAFIILHGFTSEYNTIKDHLTSHYLFLSYIVPLIVLTPVTKPVFINKVISFSSVLGTLFIVFLPLYLLAGALSYNAISEQYIWSFASGCGFILLTSYFHSKKTNLKAIVVVAGALFLATLLARRNIMLTYAGFLFVSFWIYLVYNKNINYPQKLIAVFISILVLAGGTYFFIANQDGLFKRISNRATVDSREDVLLAYFLDMDEKTSHWVIGKGINGAYDASGVFFDYEARVMIDNYQRKIIENGYLQMILKGGIVYVGLFLLIMLPAIFLGIFRSKNLFVKGCAFVILLWLIDMIAFGLPSYTFRYFLVWFSVGICYSKELRLMENDELKEILDKQKRRIFKLPYKYK